MEPVDLFFSLMVLQHNPPPVIAFVLQKILHRLKLGGIAFFQLPSMGEIEVHILPQKYVYAIAEREACRVLEVQPDGCVGQPQVTSNTFLLQKSASRRMA